MAKGEVQRIIALTVLFGASFAACGQNGEQQPTPSPSPAAADSLASPGDSTQLTVISAPNPSYPMEAKKKGVQGRVWVHLLISETGEVESADLVSGDPELGRAAQEAMKKWKFKPYVRNGKPVKVNTKMSFDFAFKGDITDKGNVTDATVPQDSSANASASPTETAGTAGEGSSESLPRKLRVSAGVANGLKLHDVTPIYPVEARLALIQGEVILQATIGKDGLIHNLTVVTGHPILAKAAMGAVEQWRYRPYILMGNPVEVETTIKVAFQMR
jgi:TonB family protein